MSLNKRGFTMVELLAVITIISVLGLIAITSITNILSSTEEEYYEEQEALMLVAGKNYFSDNLDKRPHDIGEEACVTLSTLQSNNYIGVIKDYDKNVCNTGTVCSKKVTTKNYTYYSYLKCAGSEYVVQNVDSPTVTLVNYSTKISGNNTAAKDVSYKIEDSASKIVSYRYVVYSGSSSPDSRSDWEVVKDSGWKYLDNVDSFNSSFNLGDLHAGYYRVEIQAYNSNGKLGSVVSNSINVNNYAISENIQFTSTPDPSYVQSAGIDWYKDDVVINIPMQRKNEIKTFQIIITGYDLEEGYSSVKEIYNWPHLRPTNGPYTFTLPRVEGKLYRYQVRILYATETLTYNQNASVSRMYNIDGQSPSCTTTVDPSGWTNTNVIMTGTCDDMDGSGCKEEMITSTKTVDTSASLPYCTHTIPGVVFDNVGNMTVCPVSCYKKDSVAPDTPVIDNPYAGIKQPSVYSISATSSDVLSGIKKWQVKKASGSWVDISNSDVSKITYTVPTPGSYTMYALYLRACDYAGNCSNSASTLVSIE